MEADGDTLGDGRHGSTGCGPRPIVAAEVSRYGRYFQYYCAVRPGITGLWQVSGRSDLSWEDSVRLDLFYVENWSVGFDLAIPVGVFTNSLPRLHFGQERIRKMPPEPKK